jgi:hypothetical protein
MMHGFFRGEEVVQESGFKEDPQKTGMFRAGACKIVAVGGGVRARPIKVALEDISTARRSR